MRAGMARAVCAAAALALSVVSTQAVAGAPAPSAHTAPAPRQDCLYSGGSIALFQRFEARNRTALSCAVVFSDAAADWAGWIRPWNAVHNNPDWNWSPWVAAGAGRRLVITQSLVPYQVPADWRLRGARGEYDRHARALARLLVEKGLGNSIIRLGHEANGTWYHHGLGDDASQYRAWGRFWARTVRAMRSVPGAHFRFDLSLANGYRAIPISRYWPGDDVVDYVGVDIYDCSPLLKGVTDPGERWRILVGQDGGLRDIARFARAHGKRLSIPEWGLCPRSLIGGAGDAPGFVRRIAGFARAHHVVYQSYFNRARILTLDAAPASRRAYRAAFLGQHRRAGVPGAGRSSR